MQRNETYEESRREKTAARTCSASVYFIHCTGVMCLSDKGARNESDEHQLAAVRWWYAGSGTIMISVQLEYMYMTNHPGISCDLHPRFDSSISVSSARPS